MFRQLLKDFSLSAVVAALLALVASYTGSSVIIFQAAHLAGLSEELTSSWIWAVSIGSGVTGLWLSLATKKPIICAWSTPGAALLVVMLPGLPLSEAIGAYIASAAIITVIGITGSLDVLMRRIPAAVSSGMFAGILFSFGAKVFTSIQLDPLLSLSMFACFLACKKFSPRYAMAAVMAAGIAVSMATGLMRFDEVQVSLAKPVFTAPSWSGSAILSVGLPLALVTLTGQYISGLAVLQASGFPTKSNGIMTMTGVFSMILAPFGSHAVNLSSITAAICTGREAHENPARRYVAGVTCGAFYIIVGAFGATVTTLFASLPAVFIGVLAGLALIGAFTTGLLGVLKDAENIEAGVIAFLATASGMSFLGLGAPFWGLAFGALSCRLLRKPAA